MNGNELRCTKKEGVGDSTSPLYCQASTGHTSTLHSHRIASYAQSASPVFHSLSPFLLAAMSLDTRQRQPTSSLADSPHPAVAPTTNTVPAAALSTAPQLEQKNNRFAFNSIISPQVSSYFIAGGVAGAASRTVVSPLERLKIIQSVISRFLSLNHSD